MRQSTIEKVESMLRSKCQSKGTFRCSNRGGAKLSGVVKETFRRATLVLKETKGLKMKRVSYFHTEYQWDVSSVG